jgi:hypothetical protein
MPGFVSRHAGAGGKARRSKRRFARTPTTKKIRCEADHAPSVAATGADWSLIQESSQAFIAQRPSKKRLKAIADFQPLPLAESFPSEKDWLNMHGFNMHRF